MTHTFAEKLAIAKYAMLTLADLAASDVHDADPARFTGGLDLASFFTEGTNFSGQIFRILRLTNICTTARMRYNVKINY